MKKKTDYLIVGAGPFGLVMAERIASKLNKQVLVLDKRNHIAGNCYSEVHPETGIEFHKYGTHIFHTHSQRIYDYISQFCELNGYHHQVLTTFNDRVYQMPINLETINSFFGLNLKPFEVEEFLAKKRKEEIYESPQNLEEQAITLIGRELYEAFIKGYTWKQWQRDPKELPASIIKRLPTRANYDESYFHHARYQGIPDEGYTRLFEKMIDSPLISVELERDFFDAREEIEVTEKTIYTGPIDRYFDYQHGKLEWRSVRFEFQVEPHEDFQGTSVMNYSNQEIPYTRIHEPRHLHRDRDYPKDKTLVIKEYSQENESEPYYPIHTEENKALYQKYKKMAAKESDVLFGGRLGNYVYYDMDQVIAQALSAFEKLA